MERRKFVLRKVYTNLNKLIEEAKDQEICTSLAVFKPSKILNFTYQRVEAEWDSKKIQYLESEKKQGQLFESEDENDIDNFEVVPKVPYKFQFEFEDDSGQISKMMIEDWEIGMLYWNSLEKHKDEMRACEAVKKKYFEDFAKTKDYHFFLGTTLKYHKIAPNPFVIIGDFRPKPIIQPELFV